MAGPIFVLASSSCLSISGLYPGSAWINVCLMSPISGSLFSRFEKCLQSVEHSHIDSASVFRWLLPAPCSIRKSYSWICSQCAIWSSGFLNWKRHSSQAWSVEQIAAWTSIYVNFLWLWRWLTAPCKSHNNFDLPLTDSISDDKLYSWLLFWDKIPPISVLLASVSKMNSPCLLG